MLNGIAPILIIHFYNKNVSGFVSGLPFGQELAPLVGLPVPIYLDERLTGIYVDSESKSIDISTEVEAVTDRDTINKTEVAAPIVKQTAVDSTVTVNLIAKRDTVLLTALLALSDMLLKRVVSQEYGITYLNKSTTIFGGLLHRFSAVPDSNTDLMRIELVLSNAQQKETKEKPAASTPLSKVGGPLPS